MTDVHLLERVTRRADLGLRFWDTAERTAAVHGLRVEVFNPASPQVRRSAVVSRSGVYVVHALPTFPGIRDFEFGDAETAVVGSPAGRPYRVEMKDPYGRFLPIAFDADLPFRGLFTLAPPPFSPWLPVVLPAEMGSPPVPLLATVPLFSTPTRPVPEPLAAVRAHLHEFDTGREAAWSCLGVAIDGVPQGLGLADAHGRVAVLFPYPEPPRMTLASPPEARNDFTWPIALTAFSMSVSPPGAGPAIPDLTNVLAALSNPRTVVESLDSPGLPLRLTYREALTARTIGAAGADASYLAIAT